MIYAAIYMDVKQKRLNKSKKGPLVVLKKRNLLE